MQDKILPERKTGIKATTGMSKIENKDIQLSGKVTVSKHLDINLLQNL